MYFAHARQRTPARDSKRLRVLAMQQTALFPDGNAASAANDRGGNA